jgi:hypothetical protein
MHQCENCIDLNDIDLESINAANDAQTNFMAFCLGFFAVLGAPIMAVAYEATEPGSAKKHFEDIFSGKVLPQA